MIARIDEARTMPPIPWAVIGRGVRCSRRRRHLCGSPIAAWMRLLPARSWESRPSRAEREIGDGFLEPCGRVQPMMRWWSVKTGALHA